MTALAANPPEATPARRDEAGLVAVPSPPVAAPLVPEEIVAAERSWWRGLIVGMAIGVPVCALVWMGLVALALTMTDTDWPMLPSVGMAAVVGVFAGMFLGGWAGVTARAEQLDEAELHAQHRH